MTEERAEYREVMTLGAQLKVLWTVADSVTERVATLEKKSDAIVNALTETLNGLDAAGNLIDGLTDRLDKLQDAQLGPVLESSAVLVELRGIREALERIAMAADADAMLKVGY
jgi:septal ring factor EnvC (AmiA/AmiB activator)